jgi:hypothetical protein
VDALATRWNDYMYVEAAHFFFWLVVFLGSSRR